MSECENCKRVEEWKKELELVRAQRDAIIERFDDVVRDIESELRLNDLASL